MTSVVLISPSYRRPVWGLVGLCWAVTVVVGLRYAGTRRAGRLDATLIHWVYATVGEKDWMAALLVSNGGDIPLSESFMRLTRLPNDMAREDVTAESAISIAVRGVEKARN